MHVRQIIESCQDSLLRPSVIGRALIVHPQVTVHVLPTTVEDMR